MNRGLYLYMGVRVEAGIGVYSVGEGKQADWIFYFLR